MTLLTIVIISNKTPIGYFICLFDNYIFLFGFVIS